jgi:hypothetical protein
VVAVVLVVVFMVALVLAVQVAEQTVLHGQTLTACQALTDLVVEVLVQTTSGVSTQVVVVEAELLLFDMKQH